MARAHCTISGIISQGRRQCRARPPGSILQDHFPFRLRSRDFIKQTKGPRPASLHAGASIMNETPTPLLLRSPLEVGGWLDRAQQLTKGLGMPLLRRVRIQEVIDRAEKEAFFV